MRYRPDANLDFGGRKWHELLDVERSSPESPENCKKLCEARSECFQWEHHDVECKLGASFTFGATKEPENNKPFVSGWRFDRMGSFQVEMDNCSAGADWTYHEAERLWSEDEEKSGALATTKAF